MMPFSSLSSATLLTLVKIEKGKYKLTLGIIIKLILHETNVFFYINFYVHVQKIDVQECILSFYLSFYLISD